MKTIISNLKYPFRVFTVLAIAFLFGAYLITWLNIGYHSQNILIWSIALFVLTAFINIFIGAKPIAIASFSVAIMLLGCVYVLAIDERLNIQTSSKDKITFVATVDSRPDESGKKQKVIVQSQKYGRLLVLLPKYPAYLPGDSLEIVGKIEKPEKIEDFDYPGYLKGQKVFNYVPSPDSSVKTGESLQLKYLIKRNLNNLLSKIQYILKMSLPEPQSSLASGLILGTKENLSDEFKSDLKITGLSHIVALSGYNVTIIMMALSTVLVTRIGRKKTFWFGIGLILLFVVMTGGSPSVVRAAIFSVAVLFGQSILGRPGDQTNLMLLAAVVMVFHNPFIIRYDIGFQLSFLAFSGLIYLSPILKDLLSKRKGRYIPESFRNVFCETVSAQIAVLPIMIFQFKQISLIAPFSNILILWIIPITMGYSFLVGGIGLIYLPLASFFANAAWPLLTYIIYGVQWMAQIPFASFSWY